MSHTRQEALDRFTQLYMEWADQRVKVEEAAQWMLERHAPYRKGQEVKCPQDGTSSSGKVINIESISIQVCVKSRRIYWCIAGEGGFFRVEAGSTNMPTAKDPDEMQKELF